MISRGGAVQKELDNLETFALGFLKIDEGLARTISQHVLSAGGKRIRPRIFFLFSHLLNYMGPFRLEVAAVCEFLHTASLLHDDVVDESATRRGRPTANALWNNQAAVLAGDFMYSSASILAASTANLPLVSFFAECVREMSAGELFQLEVLWNAVITETEYDRIVHGKTAALFEACAVAPALLAHAEPEIVDACRAYGRHIGFAFQIVDDLLDLTADSAELGKPVFSDLAEGKVTLPLILGLQAATAAGQSLRDEVGRITTSCGTAEWDRARLLNLIVSTGGVSLAQVRATEHVNLAQAAIATITDRLGANVSEEARIDLFELAQFVVQRRL